ncbi:MAG TPA: hypothetical protein VL172_16130, partial [Kofleriaceae bacterium]|nr:hypothetical protein [Kofleriaceae bacterium]
MLDRSRGQVSGWFRRVTWQASDTAWHRQWRTVRALATPWMREQFDAAAERLAVGPGRAGQVISRADLDGWLRAATPPGVPFDVAVLPAGDLRARFGPGPLQRRSLHMTGRVRMTHRAVPGEAVVV